MQASGGSRCFPVNFVKFLRTSFLQSTSGRLLLCFQTSSFQHFKEINPLHFSEIFQGPRLDSGSVRTKKSFGCLGEWHKSEFTGKHPRQSTISDEVGGHGPPASLILVLQKIVNCRNQVSFYINPNVLLSIVFY